MKENKKIKLSSLDKNEKIITDDSQIYIVADVLEDIEYFKSYTKTNKLHLTKKYHAHIDAGNMLDHAFENESDNMYEDWYDYISYDVTTDDKKEIQAILDDIFDRNSDNNIAYSPTEEIEIDL